MVYFRPTEGTGPAQDSIPLWPLPNQPRCYVPAFPWDTHLSRLTLTTAWLEFEWRRGHKEEDYNRNIYNLEFSPVEPGFGVRRVHAALFMPFNMDVWYLTGRVGLPTEVTGGRLEVGPSFSRSLNPEKDLSRCGRFPPMYGCWRYDGLYDGSIEPQVARVVFGDDTQAAACERPEEPPQGCRYVSLRTGELVPGGYGLLMPWQLLVGFFLLAAAINKHRRLGVGLHALVTRGLKRAWRVILRPHHQIPRGKAFLRRASTFTRTVLIWAHLVFLGEGLFWAVRIWRDSSDQIAASLGVSLFLGIVIGEIGMAFVVCYFRSVGRSLPRRLGSSG